MARMVWGDPRNKKYVHGVDRGVLNVHGSNVNVPWDGLISVVDSPGGGEPEETHLDGVKINNYNRPTDYKAVIEAYYSPPEFDECDGSFDHGDGLYSTNNSSKKFNFSYRTMIGEDDYRLHLVYNALAVPSDVDYTTTSNTVEPEPLQWDITTQPVMDEGARQRSHFYLDTTKTPYGVVRTVEEMLYGNTNHNPTFPSYTELKNIMASVPEVSVVDNGNGTWTIDAPDNIAKVIDTGERLFEVDWIGVDIVDSNTFTIRG